MQFQKNALFLLSNASKNLFEFVVLLFLGVEYYGKPHKLPQNCSIKLRKRLKLGLGQGSTKAKSHHILTQIPEQTGKYIRTIGSVYLISSESFTQYHETKSHGMISRYHCLLWQNGFRINYFCEDLTQGMFNRIHNLLTATQAKVFDL